MADYVHQYSIPKTNNNWKKKKENNTTIKISGTVKT